MFEHRNEPLLPKAAFYARLARSASLGLALVALCLAVGMVGYHSLEKLSWIDAFANAAMSLSGLGPLTPLLTNAGKLFAGCYALFSGLAFVAIVGVVIAPLIHRAFHLFHVDRNKK